MDDLETDDQDLGALDDAGDLVQIHPEIFQERSSAVSAGERRQSMQEGGAGQFRMANERQSEAGGTRGAPRGEGQPAGDSMAQECGLQAIRRHGFWWLLAIQAPAPEDLAGPLPRSTGYSGAVIPRRRRRAMS